MGVGVGVGVCLCLCMAFGTCNRGVAFWRGGETDMKRLASGCRILGSRKSAGYPLFDIIRSYGEEGKGRERMRMRIRSFLIPDGVVQADWTGCFDMLYVLYVLVRSPPLTISSGR